jgi:carbon monoxide dehydrogenase subunit G
MRIESSFLVPAPAEEAWRLLDDVPAVVPCLPGATLTEVVGDDAWKASLQVRLGPIALQFLADVTRAERDERARRVVLRVRAREAKGRGSAEATIESQLAGEDGGTRVDLVTELALRGAVAQYGRGLIGEVASSLTEEFARCIARRLGERGAPEAAAADPVPIGGLGLLLAGAWRALRRRLGRPASSP